MRYKLRNQIFILFALLGVIQNPFNCDNAGSDGSRMVGKCGDLPRLSKTFWWGLCWSFIGPLWDCDGPCVGPTAYSKEAFYFTWPPQNGLMFPIPPIIIYLFLIKFEYWTLLFEIPANFVLLNWSTMASCVECKYWTLS